jgi:hypothetical protein
MISLEDVTQLMITNLNFRGKKERLRQPGVEPGSAAWKATMITATPLTLDTACTQF